MGSDTRDFSSLTQPNEKETAVEEHCSEDGRPKSSNSSHSNDTDNESTEHHVVNEVGDGNGEPADDNALERADTNASSIAPLYSVFPTSTRVFVIIMAAIAGFVSPFSGNIYFPALTTIANEYHISSGLTNLTLTTYMIFQGLAPSVFGDFADMAGRRPTYVVSFVVYIAACIGIALQHSYAALLVLRMLQSTGSSTTISLAYGVAADVSTASERGTYMGWVSSGFLLGSAVGPTIGGLLTQYLGWRWIFWFLTIFGASILVPIIVLFPETGRNVVGDGSIPPQRWNMSLLNWLAVRKKRRELERADTQSLSRRESRASMASERNAMAAKRKLRMPNPLNTLKVIRNPNTAVLLFYNGIIFTAFYDITSSLPYIFSQTYGFDSLKIGLCFIPFGVGCFFATIFNGRMLDWNFRRIARQVGMKIHKGRDNDLRKFPLERARIQVAGPMIAMGCISLLCYGWVMQYNAPLPAPLVLLFFCGFCITGSTNAMSVMLVDYNPTSPSTATAGNNLFRCLLGAGGIAVITYMIDAMGRGWCFTFIVLVMVLSSVVCLYTLLKKGPVWREQQYLRAEEAKKKKEEESLAKENARTGADVRAEKVIEQRVEAGVKEKDFETRKC